MSHHQYVNATGVVDPNVTEVVCTFDDGHHQTYSFKCLRSLAERLEPEMDVLVDTKFGPRVAKVMEVQDDTQYNPLSGFEVRWLFDVVNMDMLHMLKATANEHADMLKSIRTMHLDLLRKATVEHDAAAMEHLQELMLQDDNEDDDFLS